MSTAAQLARAEADQVEAEEREQEEAETPDLEPGNPPPAEESEAAMDAKMHQVEREEKRHAAALAKILGPDMAQVEPCPTCGLPFTGLVVKGTEVAPEVVDAEFTEPCPKCNGIGMVRSGSHHPSFQLINCEYCTGNGFIRRAVQTAPAVAVETPTFPGADTAYVPLPQGMPDGWGRPAGHPHWGKSPADVGV